MDERLNEPPDKDDGRERPEDESPPPVGTAPDTGAQSPPDDEAAQADPEHVEPAAADAPLEAAATPTEAEAAGPDAGPSDAPPPPRRGLLDAIAERPETVIELPKHRLAAQSRRDFLLLWAGVAASATAAWWLLPDLTKARILPGPWRDRLDTLAGRVGLSPANRERALDGALTFDDDVAEALYSKERRVRTYDRSQVTPLRVNDKGRTPGPEYLAGWTLRLSGLASGRDEELTLDRLRSDFARREQVTRLVCVEGWSAIAWWGGLRFADLLAAFPPLPGARYAAIRSEVGLDSRGRPDPYYVSIDLDTARHPQTLLATEYDGHPLPLGHGAPLRLLVPMKLGLKNIKAITSIAYTADEPPDYWNERGYSKYDGL